MGTVRGKGCERYMGLSILDLVVRRLREENFAADIAYPGQKFPKITGSVAAVHIEKVDRAAMTVTVEVSIICPASLGGTTCELEALRATEALRLTGAVCVQNGCTYDGVAQVYVVQILATFTGVTEADTCKIWPGFYVYLNDELLLDALVFSEEEDTGLAAEYAMGEGTIKEVSQGPKHWNIRLEERIPAGAREVPEPEGDFTLKIITDRKKELYSGCRWMTIQRQYTKEGLRRSRQGFARSRREEIL